MFWLGFLVGASCIIVAMIFWAICAVNATENLQKFNDEDC